MKSTRKLMDKNIRLLRNPPRDTLGLIQDFISSHPRDLASELKGLSPSIIFAAVMQVLGEYSAEIWVRLYKGATGDIADKVVKDIYIVDPEFQRHIKKEGIAFPANPQIITDDDLNLFCKWVRDNSITGKYADALNWLAGIFLILPMEFRLAANRNDLLFGQEFIPLLEWMEMISKPIDTANQSAAINSFIEFIRQNKGRLTLSMDNAPTPPVKVPREAREQMEHYGYKFATPIDIPGTTNEGKDTLVRVGNQDVYLSDSYFAIFLALIVSLLKEPNGSVSKLMLMDNCGKAGSNPNTFIEKVREKFRNVLGSKDPKAYLKFIERQGKGFVRISVPPALVRVNKKRLLEGHHDSVVRNIAESLPDNVKYRK